LPVWRARAPREPRGPAPRPVPDLRLSRAAAARHPTPRTRTTRRIAEGKRRRRVVDSVTTGSQTRGLRRQRRAVPVRTALTPRSAFAAANTRPGQRCRSLPGDFSGNGLQEQLVEPAHEAGRIVELAALGEQRLPVEHLAPVLEARLVPFVLEPAHQRVLGVDLERGPALRQPLPGGGQQPAQAHARIVLLHHQARRRGGEPPGDAHALDALAERLADALRELLELALG